MLLGRLKTHGRFFICFFPPTAASFLKWEIHLKCFLRKHQNAKNRALPTYLIVTPNCVAKGFISYNLGFPVEEGLEPFLQ